MGYTYKKQIYIILIILLPVAGFQLWWLKDMYADHRLAFSALAAKAIATAQSEATYQQAQRLKTDSVLRSSLFASPALQEYNRKKQFLVLKYDMDSSGGISHIEGTNQSQEASEKRIMEMISAPDALEKAKRTDPALLAVLSQFNLVYPDSVLLRAYIKAGLKTNDLEQPFDIRFYTNVPDTVGRTNAITSMLFSGGPDNYWTVSFPRLSQYLLKKMLLPFIVSLLLVLLILGGLIFLWRGMAKQKAIEQMRATLLSNITHELKTPLTVLSALNEALLSYNGVEDPDKTKRYLTLSKDELTRLEQQIDHIISVARLEEESIPIARETFHIYSLVTSIIDRFSSIKTMEYSVSVEVKNDLMLTSKQYVSTILTNLLDNAVKYSREDHANVTITVFEDASYYWLKVADNGKGIDKQYLPYVFDKFYRVPDNDVHDVKGYGLGLSYVQELINRLNGSIKVSSEKGTGTCFTIKLPKGG